MFLEVKNIIKVASVFIGAVVGAGFASGQEILQFFTVYGQRGAAGLVLAGLLFCLVSVSVLDYIYRFRYHNYTDFITSLMGRYAGTIVEVTVMLFLLISFFVMTTGSGALFQEYIGIKAVYGAAIMSAACCIVFLFNFKGIVAINTAIAPILVLGIGFLGVYICLFLNLPVYNDQESLRYLGNWVSSSIVYVSYNSIILVTILATLLPYLNTRRVAIGSAVVGSGLLCITGLVVYALTNLFYPAVLDYEIPLLQVIERFNISIRDFYTFILFFAMFTSAVSAGFCFLNKVSGGSTFRFNLCAAAMCITAIPLSLIGFSNLVKAMYPLFGYMGLFQVLMIVLAYLFRFKPIGLRRGVED